MSKSTVVVIGGGPYGLACAAHLSGAGLEPRLLGPRMRFWESHMPHGMFLRSPWLASSISDPHGRLTLDAYQIAEQKTLSRPVPLPDFLRYAHWFAAQVAPDVDERRVVQLERADGGYRLTLEDGDSLQARRVVVATGLDSFSQIPSQLSGLPPTLALHSSELSDLSGFAGLRVVTVGAGQSAVESAALLSEAGAQVELIARVPRIRWLRSSGVLHSSPGPLRRLLYPPTDVGPPGLNQITARPDLFQRFPLAVRERIAYRSIRPAASSWLERRMLQVKLTGGQSIVSAQSASADQLRLTLTDGTVRIADRLVMATGYQVDLARHPLMTPELLGGLELFHGSPKLRDGFESSLPGLHFAGAMAAQSYGPLMRFVSGTTYAAPVLAAHVASTARSRAPLRRRAGLATGRASEERS